MSATLDTRGVTHDPGTDWRARAACRTEDPELFFPIGVTPAALQQAEEAKAICRRCPVMLTCQRWAIDTGLPYGIAGGLTEEDREASRRSERRRRTLAAWPADIPHGTHRGYEAHYRRKQRPCDDCRAAEKSYRDDLRRPRPDREWLETFPDRQHGIEGTYKVGCRCTGCKWAHKRHRQDRRAAGLEATS